MMIVVIVVIVVIVMIVVIVVVVVPVGMGMAVPGDGTLAVGAALGIERTLHRSHLSAEPPHHVGNDVIVADVDRSCSDLGSEVAVAQVPGKARELHGGSAGDFQQPLGRRRHGDDAAIVQPQAVARAQHRCLGEIEQECQAARSGKRDAPPRAPVVVELDDIGRRARPGASRENFARTRYGGAACHQVLGRVASKAGTALAKASSQATSLGCPARHLPSWRKSR